MVNIDSALWSSSGPVCIGYVGIVKVDDALWSLIGLVRMCPQGMIK